MDTRKMMKLLQMTCVLVCIISNAYALLEDTDDAAPDCPPNTEMIDDVCVPISENQMMSEYSYPPKSNSYTDDEESSKYFSTTETSRENNYASLEDQSHEIAQESYVTEAQDLSPVSPQNYNPVLSQTYNTIDSHSYNPIATQNYIDYYSSYSTQNNTNTISDTQSPPENYMSPYNTYVSKPNQNQIQTINQENSQITPQNYYQAYSTSQNTPTVYQNHYYLTPSDNKQNSYSTYNDNSNSISQNSYPSYNNNNNSATLQDNSYPISQSVYTNDNYATFPQTIAQTDTQNYYPTYQDSSPSVYQNSYSILKDYTNAKTSPGNSYSILPNSYPTQTNTQSYYPISQDNSYSISQNSYPLTSNYNSYSLTQNPAITGNLNSATSQDNSYSISHSYPTINDSNIYGTSQNDSYSISKYSYPIITEGNNPSISQDNSYSVSQNSYPIIREESNAGTSQDNSYSISQNTYPSIINNSNVLYQNSYPIITDDSNSGIAHDNSYSISQNSYPPQENSHSISQNSYPLDTNSINSEDNSYSISQSTYPIIAGNNKAISYENTQTLPQNFYPVYQDNSQSTVVQNSIKSAHDELSLQDYTQRNNPDSPISNNPCASASNKYTEGICLNENALQSCITNLDYCIFISFGECDTESCLVKAHKECGSERVFYNGGCAPQMVATCEMNTFIQDGACVRYEPNCSHDCEVVCLPEAHMVDGVCLRNVEPETPSSLVLPTPCGANTINVKGVCSTCPSTSYVENNQCMRCRQEHIDSGRCNQPIIVVQSPPVQPQNPSTVVVVQQPAPVVIAAPKPAVVQQPSVVQVISAKTPGDANVITITNIVNNSNIHNVITNINSPNINNIKLGSSSFSNNNNADTSSYRETTGKDEGPCCVIMEPRRCQSYGNKFKCFHRRYHKCGSECISDDPNVVTYKEDFPDAVDVKMVIPTVIPSMFPTYAPNYPTSYLPYYPTVTTPKSPPAIPRKNPSPAVYGAHYPMMSSGYPQYAGYQQYLVPRQPQMMYTQTYSGYQNYPSQHQLPACAVNRSNWPCTMSSPRQANCVYQMQWPYVNCAQNVNIDCSSCYQRQCHSMCFG